jgi:hypothetical protein
MEERQEKKSLLAWPPSAAVEDAIGPTLWVSMARLRSGDLCPVCQTETLDYDGLLNLACPKCGYALGGCFT